MAKKATAPAVRREKTTQMLPVRLTEGERLTRGKALADEQRELDRVDDEKRESVSQFKALAEAHHAQIRVLSMALSTGEERRRVDCEVVTDFESGWVTTTRTDTGEILEQRPLRGDEAQMEIGAE